MRFPDIIKTSSSNKLWKNENIHKGVPQAANRTAALVSFDGTTKNSPNSMVAFRSAQDEGYMVCVFEKPLGHHQKL